MQLTITERTEFFDRFKGRSDRELDALRERLEERKEVEKAAIIRLILDIRGLDLSSLRQVIRRFREEERWKECEFASAVMKQNFAATIVKRGQAKQEKTKTRVVQAGKTLVADNDMLVNLVAVAMEDDEVRKQLVMILSLDSFSRHFFLGAYENQLRLMNAPAEFCDAIALLADDAVVAKVLRLITDAPTS